MRLTAHVKSSRVKFEAVQWHRRKDKEVRTEHSRFESCAFECRWLRSAETTCFCGFSPSSIAESDVFACFRSSEVMLEIHFWDPDVSEVLQKLFFWVQVLKSAARAVLLSAGGSKGLKPRVFACFSPSSQANSASGLRLLRKPNF